VLAVAGAAAGVSSVFIGGAPASADPPCGTHGTLLSGNICQETFTSGTATFTPNASMTQLEVLLVGGGGSGLGDSSFGSFDYGPGGGGGGAVTVVDFSGDTSDPLTLVVGGEDGISSATNGTTTGTADGGFGSEFGESGESGSGNEGWAGNPGGGGGASASPASQYDGGAGVTPASVDPGTLFAGDVTCYGGGGAVGDHGGTIGVATCGGGYVTDGTSTTSVVAPLANSGGGGGAGDGTPKHAGNEAGASGVVVVRWNAPPTVTLTFDNDGHGATVPPELVAEGTDPTKPATPTASGFVFKGWYTDASLTTKADFSVPLTADATFFASWTPALATTGGTVSPLGVPIGVAALGVGVTLAIAGSRRRKTRAS
jgi:uncharacterized repeat protein (TIGR02543 family)